MHKSILRHFRKYICGIIGISKKFKTTNLDTNKREFLHEVWRRSTKIKIINPTCPDKEKLEFLAWLTITKNSSRNKETLISETENQAIKCFADVLRSYSHAKLQKVFENPILCSTFDYYVKNGLQEFFETLPMNSKMIYEQAIDDFHRNFIKHNNV